MKALACAKINLGLNVVARRADGYHNLETVFFPVPLFDTLEVTERKEIVPDVPRCRLTITGTTIEGCPDDNLVIKAYRLLSEECDMPPVDIHLHKVIPTQAGMGGGSSDAACTLTSLNRLFELGLSEEQLERMAARLGADCAFFVKSKPAYATGIGDILLSEEGLAERFKGMYMAIVKPPVAVSTKDAYAGIIPRQPQENCREVVRLPMDMWKDRLVNDFETTVCAIHPVIAEVKKRLYEKGALFAQMSGSGSAVYAFFKYEPSGLAQAFQDYYAAVVAL